MAENQGVVTNEGSGDGVRKRVNRKDLQDHDDSEKDVSTNTADNDAADIIQSSSHSKMVQLKDPLKWFGVLLPQALHQSQDKFKRALAASCELANHKRHLEEVRKTFREMLKEKENIINSV